MSNEKYMSEGTDMDGSPPTDLKELLYSIEGRVKQYSVGADVDTITRRTCTLERRGDTSIDGLDIKIFGEYVPLYPVVDAVEDSAFIAHECVHVDSPDGESYLLVFVESEHDYKIRTTQEHERSEYLRTDYGTERYGNRPDKTSDVSYNVTVPNDAESHSTDNSYSQGQPQ